MNTTKAFSESVLSSFADDINVTKSQCVESMRASENARKALERLVTRMTKVEKNLPRTQKDKVRTGKKTLNNKSFRQFVLDTCSGKELTFDEILSRAKNAGYVSTSSYGLRSSLKNTCRSLIRDSLLKHTKSGAFKA